MDGILLGNKFSNIIYMTWHTVPRHFQCVSRKLCRKLYFHIYVAVVPWLTVDCVWVVALLLLLLLSCHRRLRMFSEALELYVEGGLVSHSWCMCVVCHSYSGLDGGRNGGG